MFDAYIKIKTNFLENLAKLDKKINILKEIGESLQISAL